MEPRRAHGHSHGHGLPTRGEGAHVRARRNAGSSVCPCLPGSNPNCGGPPDQGRRGALDSAYLWPARLAARRGSTDATVTRMICVLGDAHLDVVVSLAGPVEPETDTPAATSVGAGGQAANVAAWITALGGRARLIAAQAADPAGRMVAEELARRGVELAGPVLPGRTGVVVSLSDRGRSRSMLTDRGVGTELAAGHLT